MNFRYLAAASLLTLTLGTGCVRRTTTRDFGLSPRTAPTRPKRPAALSPDASLRTVFKRQTPGAFNPLSDDQRVQALQGRLKMSPQDLAARLELGSVYESYRLFDNAFDQYLEALRLSSSDDASAEQAAQAVLGLSRSARASHRTAEAIPLVEAVLKARPAANTWNELGLLYQEMRDLAASERAFQETVDRSPESDRAHNNLGYALALQHKFDEALRQCDEALRLAPNDAQVLDNFGCVLAEQGRWTDAATRFGPTATSNTAPPTSAPPPPTSS